MGDSVKRLTYTEAMTDLADYEAISPIISAAPGRITVVVKNLTGTPEVVFSVEDWGTAPVFQEVSTLKEALALLGIEEEG